ncbi:MAG: transporter [Alphaproteobacteria bacterium]|nr:transporter [Alphaproteobacteria bacterium]
MPKSLAPLRALPLVALLGACTLGPNYAGPPPLSGTAAPPAAFVRTPDAANPAAPAAARWWSVLGDPLLDSLQQRALAGNPGIAAAEARLRQARAQLRLDRANQLPSVGAQGTIVQARLPGLGSASSSSALSFYNVGLDASWEPDLFGGQRRTAEASRAGLGAAEADVADAQVRLTAEVAQDYVALRDRQQRLALTREAAGLQRRMLELTRQRVAAGTASQLELERVGTLLETSEAQAVPIEAEIDAALDALAVLTGAAPGALDTALAAPAPVPLPPARLAVGDPAALLQRRPDVRAAERQLAARTARIGVAEAARFPRISFMGILGLGGSSPADLVDLGSLSALSIPRLTWSFLDFGRGTARVRQAEAARDEAEATYRQTVLAALQDAEDSLSRFAHRRDSVASAARQLAAAGRAAALTEQRFAQGTASRIDALEAERQQVVARSSLAAASAALTADFIAVHKALGLGWAPTA